MTDGAFRKLFKATNGVSYDLDLSAPEEPVSEDAVTLPRPKESPVRAPGKKKQRPSTPLRPKPGQRPEPKGEENPDVVLF
ncbi:MAG: hypothetical protein ACTSRU_18425, partial [Candidatus Hodarchaeales archaeon]